MGVTVDGGDCIVCFHQDPVSGACTKYGHDAMTLRDGVRECDSFVDWEEHTRKQDELIKEQKRNQEMIELYNSMPKIGDRA